MPSSTANDSYSGFAVGVPVLALPGKSQKQTEEEIRHGSGLVCRRFVAFARAHS